MPFEFAEITTPGGRRCLLIETTGFVTLHDAEALGRELAPGSRFHGGVVLSRIAKGTDFDAEARKYFPSLQPTYRRLAAVVGSPLVRAMVNLMIRLTPSNGGEARIFTDEADALAWLDES
jgi:hypothetical protein